MLDCELKTINRVKHSIPFKMEMHTHKYDELTYYISGKGTTKINGTVYPYREHTFAFYRAGTPHNESNADPCDIIWTHLTFNIEGIELQEGVFEDSDDALWSCLQKLRNLSLEQQKYNKLLVESLLSQVIITAAQRQEKTENSGNKLDWQQILNLIDSNINQNIDFVLLAKKNHYSYDRFRHLFCERFGMSPYSYLVGQRIAHAKRLLKTTDSTITVIAFDCGFNSSSQFTNIFKKYTSLTPKEYRNSKKSLKKHKKLENLNNK